MYILFTADFDEHEANVEKFDSLADLYAYWGVDPDDEYDYDLPFVEKLIRDGIVEGEWHTYILEHIDVTTD